MNSFDGYIHPDFSALEPVFADALRETPVGGAAFALRVGGKEVVNVWGGNADSGKPWVENTSTVIFSCTKGLVSLLAAKLVAEGKLDLDLPVSHYWPEFAQNGKSQITVRQAMSHHAGLSALRYPIEKADVLDWSRMVHHLEVAEPLFPADGPHQYHAVTFGWLVGEILHRVTGKTLGPLMQESLSKPLSAETWIGAPKSELGRVAKLLNSPKNPPAITADDPIWTGLKVYERDAMTLGNAFPMGLAEGEVGFNDPEIRMAEIGGAGGIATASALAKIWSAAAGAENYKFLNQETIDDMTVMQSTGLPAIPIDPPQANWGSGFMLSSEARSFLSNKSFGHDGFGGQVTFADVDAKVGFAFVTNDMQVHGDNRANSLVAALRKIL
jgi:CubicO group peptidase (beta-lactamase class C family)